MKTSVEAGTGSTRPPVGRDPMPLKFTVEAEARAQRRIEEIKFFWVTRGGTLGEVEEHEGAA